MIRPTVECEGIAMHALPWVRGMKVEAYHGRVDVKRRIKSGDEAAFWWLFCVLARKTRLLECNTLVSLEIEIDPWAGDGQWLVEMGGVAAQMEEL